MALLSSFLCRFPFLLLIGFAAIPAAQPASETPRPFVSGSLQKIVAERQGKPFILAVWSVTCTHCPEELKALGKLKAAHPALDIVLVAADAPEDLGGHVSAQLNGIDRDSTRRRSSSADRPVD